VNTLARWFGERAPLDPETLKRFGSEPVPDHLRTWWWCLGGTPAYLFLLQIATGILLSFHYVPSPDHAWESVRNIREQVPYGWYLRSIHSWSSHFMIVAVILHLMRVFFTGSYRKPRELNWVVGVGLLGVTLMFGFTGYSLIYEQLSYWGATVAGNITESVPFVGPYLANFIRGGEQVGHATLTRFFVFHIGVLPTLLIGLLVVHFTFIRLLGVSEWRFAKSSGPATTFPFFPDHFLTEVAIGVTLMFLLTILAIVFPAGLAEKANPLVTPQHIKPEWYFYFTFRWLKLTSLTFAVLSLGLFGFIMATWPFIDAQIRKRKPNSEVSILIGTIVIVVLLVFTVWETIVLHSSH